VPNSFSRQFTYLGTTMLAVVVPELRQDGMHYEVNIPNYPRFFMKWSELGRYDLTAPAAIPYEMLLTVSDLIERAVPKK
jgi:hypothetical protein